MNDGVVYLITKLLHDSSLVLSLRSWPFKGTVCRYLRQACGRELKQLSFSAALKVLKKAVASIMNKKKNFRTTESLSQTSW